MENKIENAEFDNQKNEVGNILKLIKNKIENFKNRVQSSKSNEGNVEGLKTFTQLEETYNEMLSVGRYDEALYSLKTMCEKASTQGEQFKLKGYLLASMLTGLFKNYSSANIKSFVDITKDMGFGPLFWLTDVDQSEKVLSLLNGISEGNNKIENFSEVVSLNTNNSESFGSGIGNNYVEFNSKFQKYWDKNGEEILKHIKNIKNRGENN